MHRIFSLGELISKNGDKSCFVPSVVVGQGSQVPLLHDHDGGAGQSKLRIDSFYG